MANYYTVRNFLYFDVALLVDFLNISNLLSVSFLRLQYNTSLSNTDGSISK